jgi:hypothetical protein
VLDVDGLADYTGGRLDPDDDETAAVLARSLAEARRWCGWHVCPVITSEVTLDGPGGLLLRLPTLRVVEITALTEAGVQLDLDVLEWSQIGLVRKLSGACWTPRFSGVMVNLSHGFDESEAADFEAAVLSVADRKSLAAAGGAPTVVGPFRWGGSEDKATGGTAFTSTELSILEQYRLERPA